MNDESIMSEQSRTKNIISSRIGLVLKPRRMLLGRRNYLSRRIWLYVGDLLTMKRDLRNLVGNKFVRRGFLGKTNQILLSLHHHHHSKRV